MIVENDLRLFNDKIDQYYLSCLPLGFSDNFNTIKKLKTLPIPRLDILDLYIRAKEKIKKIPAHQLAFKLIDIKINYCYLKTSTSYFYRGTTLIVGNNELEKINPNTFSLLRGNQYRVFIISVLIEEILDLLQIIFFDEIIDYSKNKWSKILSKVEGRFVFRKKEKEMLLFFKDYRTAEMHKYSKVRSFLSKEKWNHFQAEEDILTGIINRIIIYDFKNRLFCLVIIFVITSFGLAQYYQKVKEDKKNRTIINYCEDVRWRSVNNEEDYNFFENFLLNDEVACGDFLYLKPKVKKSSTGICHEDGSAYYLRTKEYKVFYSVEDCLKSGGRLPYNN